MPYRPRPEHRRNVNEVILPLTAAVHDVYGSRMQDQGRPIGAFYTHKVSSTTWEHLGGIWYRARIEQSVLDRRIDPVVRASFARSIQTGEAVALPSGTVVTWESISEWDSIQLPPPLAASRIDGS